MSFHYLQEQFIYVGRLGLQGPPCIFKFGSGRGNQRRSVVRVSRESNVHHRTEAIAIADSEHQKTIRVSLG